MIAGTYRQTKRWWPSSHRTAIMSRTNVAVGSAFRPSNQEQMLRFGRASAQTRSRAMSLRDTPRTRGYKIRLSFRNRLPWRVPARQYITGHIPAPLNDQDQEPDQEQTLILFRERISTAIAQFKTNTKIRRKHFQIIPRLLKLSNPPATSKKPAETDANNQTD